MLTTIPQRQCSKCERFLPFKLFNPRPNKDRRTHWCFDCQEMSRNKTNGASSRKQFESVSCNVCGKKTKTALCRNCKPKQVHGLYCYSCPFVPICNLRLDKKLWVLCEIPDQNDITRAEIHGEKHEHYLPPTKEYIST
jgi:hypothetical protein